MFGRPNYPSPPEIKYHSASSNVKIGDIVWLRSGGPSMTVTALIGEEHVQVVMATDRGIFGAELLRSALNVRD
jgi:hypothetical protein